MQRIPFLGLSLTVVALLGAVASCANEADNCKRWKACKPEGGATSASGGDAGADSGGTSAGGKSGSTSGGTSGSKTTAPCNGKCSGTTPVCDVDTNKCVECLKSSSCEDAAKPVCDTGSNVCVGCLSSGDCTVDATKPVCKTETTTCVGCLANTDCTSATASLCDTATNTCGKCSIDADCTHISGKGVCNAGTCVQCTGVKYSGCGQLEGKNLVCDSLTNTCSTDKTEKMAAECQSCISDAQCIAGQVCALQTFNGSAVGYFCFWKQGDTANGAPADCTLSTNRPFVKVQSDVKSIDGTTATLCTLATSTCTALNQFRATDCAPTGTPNDNLCGFVAGVDSKCVAYGTTQYRCTTACGSNDDCKSGFSCNIATTPDTCSL